MPWEQSECVSGSGATSCQEGQKKRLGERGEDISARMSSSEARVAELEQEITRLRSFHASQLREIAAAAGLREAHAVSLVASSARKQHGECGPMSGPGSSPGDSTGGEGASPPPRGALDGPSPNTAGNKLNRSRQSIAAHHIPPTLLVTRFAVHFWRHAPAPTCPSLVSPLWMRNILPISEARSELPPLTRDGPSFLHRT